MSDPNSPSARFQIWRAALPPALRLLPTVNLASFAVSAVLAILAAFGLGAVYALLIDVLTLPGDPAKALFRPWTLFTYGFFEPIVGGIWGLISFAFAMYWLNWLGRDFEEGHGGYRLFGLYLGAAVFGGALALALGACASPPPPPPNMSPGGPAVDVIQRAGEPVQLFWNPPRALRVEIRNVETQEQVWAAAAGPTRLGPQADLLPAPLSVQARGIAPGSDPPGGFPPDGGGAWATAPELVPGTRYIVTVVPCIPSGEGTLQPMCDEQPPLSYTFVARR